MDASRRRGLDPLSPVEMYFGFHEPVSLWRALTRGDVAFRRVFGHVEAWGYTADDIWFFFDPGKRRTRLFITRDAGEIEDMMARRLTVCDSVFRTAAGHGFAFPLHFPMNCVTQCAGLAGIRAFTVRSLRRRLSRENAWRVK